MDFLFISKFSPVWSIFYIQINIIILFAYSYNTPNNDLAVRKANNKRGEKSLLWSGVSLYNGYLKDRRWDWFS